MPLLSPSMSSPTQYRTIAYAAGASLTAATFVYVVFGPTWFIDSNPSSSASQRKKTVVGLANPANDCFVRLPSPPSPSQLPLTPSPLDQRHPAIPRGTRTTPRVSDPAHTVSTRARGCRSRETKPHVGAEGDFGCVE